MRKKKKKREKEEELFEEQMQKRNIESVLKKGKHGNEGVYH